MTWYNTIDTGAGYTKDTDQARWHPEPVRRALTGWFEAGKSLPGLIGGDPIDTILDLSGRGHHLTYAGGQAPADRSVYCQGPPDQIIPPGSGSFAVAAYTCTVGYPLHGLTVVVCASVPFYHNSMVPASWGYPLVDSYMGPLIGSAIAGQQECLNDVETMYSVEMGVPSSTFRTPPHGNRVVNVDEIVVLGLTFDATSGDSLMVQDGQLVARHHKCWWHNPPEEVPYSQIELQRGGNFKTIRGAMFHDAALTAEELKQQAAYLSWACEVGTDTICGGPT